MPFLAEGVFAVAVLSCLGQPAVNRLKNFRKPVLIVMGKSTVSFHRRINDILAAQCPVVERLELPGTHAAVVTEQAEFLNGLQSFLERHR